MDNKIRFQSFPKKIAHIKFSYPLVICSGAEPYIHDQRFLFCALFKLKAPKTENFQSDEKILIHTF